MLFEDFEKKIGADRVKLQDQYDAMHCDIIKQVKDADTKVEAAEKRAEAAEKECIRLRQENSALRERVNKLTDDLTSSRKDATAELPARLQHMIDCKSEKAAENGAEQPPA